MRPAMVIVHPDGETRAYDGLGALLFALPPAPEEVLVRLYPDATVIVMPRADERCAG